MPFDASGEKVKEVLGKLELRGYYVEVYFSDGTIDRPILSGQYINSCQEYLITSKLAINL